MTNRLLVDHISQSQENCDIDCQLYEAGKLHIQENEDVHQEDLNEDGGLEQPVGPEPVALHPENPRRYISAGQQCKERPS